MSTGVLLMTFGSATTSADVPDYLRSVRGGAEPDPAVVAEFERRYDRIGRSPLVEITREQASGVQQLLDEGHGEGVYAVTCGMRHSAPTIADAVTELAAGGATSIRAVILSPQYSPVIMAGYHREVEAAAAAAGVTVSVAAAWFDNDHFIACLADLLTTTLAREQSGAAAAVPVVFTAHSLPRSVVDRDPGYMAQLRATAARVAAAAGLSQERWQFAYQSAGHTQEEWLRPDFKELMPGLRAAGHDRVVLVPTQFLSDHLEVLYDIDVAGTEEAREQGLGFARIPMPNCHPELLKALAEVAVAEPASV